MKQFLLWPAIIVILHFLERVYAHFIHETQGSIASAFAMVGQMFLDIALIFSLFIYIPLLFLYSFYAKKRIANIPIFYCLIIGLIAFSISIFFVPFAGINGWSVIKVVDPLLMSKFWRYSF